MRLHRLAVTAFGPFGATQEIDFDELSAAGLFLLHGPTGAGKTSVLDAVCYALYGQVPGARQGSGLSLRSDHADPLTPTEVVLEFTVGERRLEVTRRPEQPRPKKRGTGMTREKAQTLLREYSRSASGAASGAGEWKALSRSHQEIGEEIGQLLGMSREQFCQVVLLPQGDFARFLRADELARGKLLGKLFDTGRFAAVEERLGELRRAAEKRVAAGDERLLALAHRMAQAAGRTTEFDGHPLPDPTPGEPGLADAVLEWAAVARTGARERRDIARCAVRAAETAHDAAQRAAEADRERAELQHRHAEARRRADDLERRRPDHDRLRELLERARAADAVVPALDLRAAAARDHRTAETTERQARARLSAEPGLAEWAARSAARIPDPRTPREAAPAQDAAPVPAEDAPHVAATTPDASALGTRPSRPHTGVPAPAEASARTPGAVSPGESRPGTAADEHRATGTDTAVTDATAVADGSGRAAGVAGDGGVPSQGRGVRGCAGASAVLGVEEAGVAGVAPSEADEPLTAVADGPGRTAGVADAGDTGVAGERRAATDGPEPNGGGDAADPTGVRKGRTHSSDAAPPARPAEPTEPTEPAEPPALAEADAAWLGRIERRVREELGALGAARRGEARAEAVAAEIAALDREARADDEAVEEADEWLAGWEETHRAHQRRIESAQEAATRAEQLGGRIEPAERRLEAARQRDVLAERERLAREELLRAREGAATARQNWLDLKERRLRGIAAELAAGLRPGEPCAVCGATEHPSPARPGDGHVDRTAEEAALADYQRAEEAREEAERTRNALREALAGAEAAAEGGDAAELGRALAELRAAYAEARDAAADGHAAREALDRAEREHARRTAQRQEAERRAAARTSHREALARERAGLLAELEQARGADATVAERAARLERQAGLLSHAAEAARNAEAAAARLKEADARLADAAYRAGFDTPEQAAEAVLPPDRQRDARRRLDAWQTESAAVAAELSDPKVLAAAQAPPADPAATRAAAEAATRALREVSAADAAARTRCEELDALSAQAVADARRLAPLRAEYDRIARLASLAAGTSADNERRMRLEAYVLAARLEQVAAAASARLRQMSSGRYTLVHSDARSGGRGRSGLGLHVIDAWTGRERDTATLSGGETFFASLALALGLADVVTDEAGGVRLDTLFIDEGFGSLDEQTLDEVMDVLDSLRERDRTVGIVSHVADLRRRIPAQLEVVKGREGSAVRHRTAVAP
ncbi:AAA family ATPase [Streptomyces hygroscopicus subsp. hygroscopicus]|uniref:AAA family ATPase n=1 Tax=Streptomyces hygroscopicus TaxID=1912 RepID=UPI001C660E89|nr:AAA family ATPase [Streptomyces hygroscopicus]MBW8089624.1 AAA family ATPase [Streptomyces hygroscopicus subsp. hygroscopicus]